MSSKPRLLLPAIACAIALAGAAPAAAAQPAPPASGGLQVGTALIAAPSGAFAGKANHLRGTTPLSGIQIVQAADVTGAWTTIGQVSTGAGDSFELNWKPAKPGRFEIRTLPAVAGASDATAQDAAAAGLGQLTVYRLQRTTWYGPGNYAARTACGHKLTRRTLGVAHRTLPCGTMVEFFKGGRSVTVPVIDRGPFVRGVTWDLTYAAAKRVRMLGSERIGALVIR